MSRLVDLNLSPSRQTLRHFGFIALGGFGLLALLAWQEWAVFAFGLGDARQMIALGLAAIGLLAGALSLVWPRGNWPLYVGLSLATFPIGFVLSYLVLGLLFYLIITPIGLILRLLGKDPLDRRILPEADSYWVESNAGRSPDAYFKQF